MKQHREKTKLICNGIFAFHSKFYKLNYIFHNKNGQKNLCNLFLNDIFELIFTEMLCCNSFILIG